MTLVALYLLYGLKSLLATVHGSSGHRLFISALTTASNVTCYDTYSNKSWCIVSQGMLAPREIDQTK